MSGYELMKGGLRRTSVLDGDKVDILIYILHCILNLNNLFLEFISL